MITQFITFFLSIICLISGMVIVTQCYKKEYQAPYRFRNTFPYELNEVKQTTFLVVGKILMCLSFIALGAYFIVFPGDRTGLGSIKVIAAFINVIGIFTLISILSVILINMHNAKLHVIADTFLFTFSFILTLAIAIMGFWTLKDVTSSSIDLKKVICAGIASFISLLELVLVFNPKIRNWSLLEEKGEENGTMLYKRPDWFVLAYSEWGFILSVYLDAVILFIMFI